jgi:hypothetical protein
LVPVAQFAGGSRFGGSGIGATLVTSSSPTTASPPAPGRGVGVGAGVVYVIRARKLAGTGSLVGAGI